MQEQHAPWKVICKSALVESIPNVELVQPEEAQEDQPCEFACEVCENSFATKRALAAHANCVYGKINEVSDALHGIVCVACLTSMANVGALQQYVRICRRCPENDLRKSWRRTGWKDSVPGSRNDSDLLAVKHAGPLRSW